MKFRIEKKYIYWGFTAFLVVAASICFYYLLFRGANISSGFHAFVKVTMPILDGFLLSYLLTPVLNAVERKLITPLWRKCRFKENGKNRKKIRGISILITVIIVITALYLFLATVIPQIVRSIQSIIFQFPIYVNNLTNWITRLLADNPDIEQAVMNLLDKYSGELNTYLNQSLLPQMNELIKNVSLSFLGFLMRLWNLIIGFIISIYILGSKEMFAGQAKKIAYALFETKTANVVISDVRFTHKTFSGFMVGKIIDSIIIGFICFAGTSIIGTPYSVLVSVIVGITNVIPFFGPYLGAIPSALLILMVDPVQCLYFIIFILFLQQFDGNILGPKILGDSTGLSGFWVIFAITLFGGLFGILGMIAGVPVFAVIYAGIRALINQMLAKKKMPTSTEEYMDVGSIENDEFIRYDPEEEKAQEQKKKEQETKEKKRNKEKNDTQSDKRSREESSVTEDGEPQKGNEK